MVGVGFDDRRERHVLRPADDLFHEHLCALLVRVRKEYADEVVAQAAENVGLSPRLVQQGEQPVHIQRLLLLLAVEAKQDHRQMRLGTVDAPFFALQLFEEGVPEKAVVGALVADGVMTRSVVCGTGGQGRGYAGSVSRRRGKRSAPHYRAHIAPFHGPERRIVGELGGGLVLAHGIGLEVFGWIRAACLSWCGCRPSTPHQPVFRLPYFVPRLCLGRATGP